MSALKTGRHELGPDPFGVADETRPHLTATGKADAACIGEPERLERDPDGASGTVRIGQFDGAKKPPPGRAGAGLPAASQA